MVSKKGSLSSEASQQQAKHRELWYFDLVLAEGPDQALSDEGGTKSTVAAMEAN